MTQDAGIHELSSVWEKRLKSVECPPILGLAPLSGEAVDTITKFISEIPGRRFEVLLGCLNRYPAIMSLWLARKAGEAYEDGAFWEQFSKAIGIDIPTNSRLMLVQRFRRACFLAMHDWISPQEADPRKHVGEFLFQAGLPLSHCNNFARHMYACERRTGLPDLEDTDAADYLRELLLESMRPEPIPVLKRALRSHAGAYICEAALRVVHTGSFNGINPALGLALEAAFKNETHRTLRRAARQPFLRIGDDLCSFEMIGPAQDHHLISETGMSWVINSIAYRHPYAEPFLYPIQGETRVVAELRGLRHSQTLLRTFVLDLHDRDYPFMVFSAETRKLVNDRPSEKNELSLDGGEYWLVHSPSLRLVECGESYEWGDGQHVTSFMKLVPGKSFELTDGTLSWRFQTATAPFIEIAGKSMISDEGVRIHYGWDNLPDIWIPFQEDDETSIKHWNLSVKTDSHESTLPLQYEATYQNGTSWIKCRASGESMLGELKPGLHHIKFSLERMQRSRIKTSAFLWVGLTEVNAGESFKFSARPENLVHDKCINFMLGSYDVRHSGKHIRQGTLCFLIEQQLQSFHWSRKGNFLESFEKRPGHGITVEPADMGSVFSAAPTTRRWLRIWPFVGAQAEVEVRVNGQTYLRTQAESQQRYIDVSLATLAIQYPNGGGIVLCVPGLPDISIAKFTPPLVPKRVDSLDHGSTLFFHFPDRAPLVRPVARELTHGMTVERYEQRPGKDGLMFVHEGAPTINWKESTALSLSDLDLSHPGSCICVSAKADDTCAPGIWMVEFEARRGEDEDWQLLTGEQERHVPMIVSLRPQKMDSVRSKIFWIARDACHEHLLNMDGMVYEEYKTDIPELLCETFVLTQSGFDQSVADQFVWLEHLYSDLSRVVSTNLMKQDPADVQKLLFIACGSRNAFEARSLFVSVPSLLGLPGNYYHEVSKANPLSSALNWCGRLAGYDNVIDAFRDSAAGILDNLDVLMRFRNFNAVMIDAQTAHDRGVQSTDDFTEFDYVYYWDRVICPMDHIDPLAEWNGQSALDADHAKWGVASLMRRRNIDAGNDLAMGHVACVLNLSSEFRSFLMNRLASHRDIMPANAWREPWLRVDVPNDHLINCCVRFASLFALAARASGAGWMKFQEIIDWLNNNARAEGSAERTLSTLVGMARELFGYYLMFWELMIRTYPHARE